MNFKKWVKSIQTAAYNGARTVVTSAKCVWYLGMQAGFLKSLKIGTFITP